jgi:hypothetical protein
MMVIKLIVMGVKLLKQPMPIPWLDNRKIGFEWVP